MDTGLVSTTLVAGALGGTVMAVADTAIGDCGALFGAMAVLGAEGMLFGSAALALFGVAHVAHRRLSRRVPTSVVAAALVGLGSAPAWAHLFSGAGVRDTALGTYGPVLAILLTTGAAFVAYAGLLPALLRTEASLAFRVLAPVGCLCIAVVLALVDRAAYVGLYPGVHFTLGLVCVGLATLAALPFVHRHLRVRGAAACAALALCGFGITRSLGSSQTLACLDARPGLLAHAAWTLRTRADLDGDGASSILGGGDCNDFNRDVGLGAVERSGDSVDSNCDGRDDPPPERDSRSVLDRPYRTDSATRDRLRTLAAGRPTVVLLIDALRHDRLDQPAFPRLATLFREAIRLERAYAHSSSTRTGMAAMHAGRLHPRVDEPTLASRLHAAGKRSAFVGLDVTVAMLSELYPVLRGFDRVVAVPTEHNPRFWGGGVTQATGDALTRAALRLLETDAPPDLLWVHYFDVHQWHRLAALPALDGAARYDAAVAIVDAALAPWIAQRDRINLVVLSDHGELYAEHGRQFHTARVVADLVRVPWLIAIPGAEPARIDAPVGLREVAPTLMDLVGAALPTSWEARSVLGLVGVSDPGPGPLILAFETQQWALLDSEWRLRLDPRSGATQLFRVSDDPREIHDLATTDTERVARMTADLRAAASELQRYGGPLRFGYE